MFNDDKNFLVYVTNYVGNFGTKILIEEKNDELLNRFSKCYLDKALKDIDESLKVKDDNMSSFFIYDSEAIEKGGVLTALWKLCERHKLGLRYSLKDIPILQGTIEISNYFDFNPYRLLTSNAKVLLIEKNNIAENADKYNIGAYIGETNNKKQRLRIDGEVDAFLAKDYKDEIDKVINGRSKRKK